MNWFSDTPCAAAKASASRFNCAHEVDSADSVHVSLHSHRDIVYDISYDVLLGAHSSPSMMCRLHRRENNDHKTQPMYSSRVASRDSIRTNHSCASSTLVTFQEALEIYSVNDSYSSRSPS